MKKTYFIELIYKDESEMHFEVSIDGREHDNMAVLSMITRGTLMASMAVRATAYDDQGFDVCAYQK